jgi:hypothetical protein
MDGCWHRPVGVRGWTHVVFRRERDGARRVLSLDEMLAHLDAWDRTADRRMSPRRIVATARREIERRIVTDRRAEDERVEHRADSEVPVPRSTEPHADRPPGPVSARDAAPASATRDASRHAH